MSFTREQRKRIRRRRRIMLVSVIVMALIFILGAMDIYSNAMEIQLPRYDDDAVPNAYTMNWEVCLW